ncbi:YdcF family protein [Fischerella sp. PCC 9605]|uniref:YdcF family protein n=1 Tax=Fischerella sp. PCC 9605 TaxID=1173024 RepID=UPI00047BDAA4|nr:YdcF family protein [Fischerella sp. PCC 9605]
MKPLFSLLKRYWILALAGLILYLLMLVPVRLAIASYQAPQPEAILTLGGETLGQREEFTAEFAHWYPSLEIWVSSGMCPNKARKIFQAAGISDNRLHLDYRAVDTVTNFTTLISDFKQHHIQHLYLITSDYHMPRAKAIATIILGSQGITFTPLSVRSNQPKESNLRILRDICRSLLWIVTGRTGASLQFDVDLP